MEQYEFIYWSAYSLSPAAVMAIFRYRNADTDFHPFIYLLWMGFINEALSTMLIKTGHSNAINNNIYVLLEAGLLLWQFYKWGVLKRYGWMYVIAGVLVGLGWGLENVWLGEIRSFDNLFRMYTAVLVISLALIKLTQRAAEIRERRYTKTCFLICAGLLLYFCVNLYLEILLHFFHTATWTGALFWWSGWVNIVANILFFIAVLWIPGKAFYTED